MLAIFRACLLATIIGTRLSFAPEPYDSAMRVVGIANMMRDDPEGWRYTASAPPTSADPRGRISCVGEFPPFAVPESLAQERYTSLIDICAHNNYGGLRGRNVGGYCGWFLDSPLLVFDLDTASRFWHSPDLSTSRRIVLFCQTKCECVSPGLDTSKEVVTKRFQTVFEIDFAHGVETNIPLADFDTKTRPFTNVFYYALGNVANAGKIRLREVLVTAARDSEITCRGELPSERYLPFDLVVYSYPTLHSLCASNLVGGHKRANAGGHCSPYASGYNPRTKPDPSWPLTVIFPDEFSRHPLTLSNLPKGLAVMLWCAKHCWCPRARRAQSRRPQPLIRWLWDASADFKDGGLTIRGYAPNPNGPNVDFTIALMRTEVPVNRQNVLTATAISDSCGQPGDCQTVWPTAIPTPTMRDIPLLLNGNRRVELLPTPAPESLPFCGRFCSSSADCDQAAPDCRCVVNSAFSQLAGHKIIARCLVLTQVWNEIRKNGNKRSQEWGPICACNSSYTSRSCCSSQSDIVWEDKEFNQGALTMDILDVQT